jgi:hypothetical protein
MLLQLIQGRVHDAELYRRQNERWLAELKPGATGYLGCTWGISPDGVAFMAARFESPAAAQTNSDRPEQGTWWAETEKAFDDVTFRDCTDIDTMFGGGSDEAGFVQVIQGRVKDQEAARAMMRDAEDQLVATRPDILGGVMAWHGDAGEFTQIVYFRSESEARSGETSEANDDVDRQYTDMMAEEPTFIDLPEPQFD